MHMCVRVCTCVVMMTNYSIDADCVILFMKEDQVIHTNVLTLRHFSYLRTKNKMKPKYSDYDQWIYSTVELMACRFLHGIIWHECSTKVLTTTKRY